LNKVYCHKSLISEVDYDAISGKYYKIYQDDTRQLIIIGEDNCFRFYSGDNYKHCFWKLTDREYIKMKREEKLKKLGIIK